MTLEKASVRKGHKAHVFDEVELRLKTARLDESCQSAGQLRLAIFVVLAKSLQHPREARAIVRLEILDQRILQNALLQRGDHWPQKRVDEMSRL